MVPHLGFPFYTLSYLHHFHMFAGSDQHTKDSGNKIYLLFLAVHLLFILKYVIRYESFIKKIQNNFRNDDSVNFMLFFFIFFLQCIFSVISCFSGEWFWYIIILFYCTLIFIILGFEDFKIP